MGDPADHVSLAEVPDGRWQAASVEADGVFQVVVGDRAGPLHLGDGFPALQCPWPDKQGRFPTDTDYAEPLRARQPLLASWFGGAYHEVGGMTHKPQGRVLT
jgi:hypothetical protein